MGNHVEIGVFVGLFVVVAGLGFLAARWRRPASFNDLDSWGLGNRSFGPYVSWFLLGGDLYTAYTFVALPALMYGVGAAGFYAVPFAVIGYPLGYVALARLWSVSHVHGLVTPADFVRARFGSRGLALLVAVTGIVATMPYIALQLIGVEAVLATLGVPGKWPLAVAFAVLAVFTYHSGLRAPALIAFVKDILIGYVVLAVLLTVGMSWNSWGGVFHAAQQRFGSPGPLLPTSGQLGYVSLALGSALAIFLYPHAITGLLAAKNRQTVQRTIATLPLYTGMLGIVALLGYVAIAYGIRPVGGDGNTVLPALLHNFLPPWLAGFAFAAIGVGALVPASVMSIATANLFARNVFREYLRPHASAATELRVSKLASLFVKLGAAAFVILLNPQFSVDLQLIGSVLILQTLPAVGLGLYTSWFHRRALVAGLLAGLGVGTALLYGIPRVAPNGTVLRQHFGGSAWPLSHLGIHNGQSVYVGLVALAANLLVAVALTPLLRSLGQPDGIDITWKHDYEADEGDPSVRRLAELVDGGPMNPVSYEPAVPRHGQPPRPSTVDYRTRALNRDVAGHARSGDRSPDR